jgi:hypothetical protein
MENCWVLAGPDLFPLIWEDGKGGLNINDDIEEPVPILAMAALCKAIAGGVPKITETEFYHMGD